MKDRLLILFCALLLAACGGGSNGENIEIDSTELPKQVEPEEGLPEPESNPPEPPKDEILAERSCPAVDSENGVAINTGFRYTFSGSEDYSFLEDLELVLDCGGESIQGSTQIADNELIFFPDGNLPKGASCTSQIIASENDQYEFKGFVEKLDVGNKRDFIVAFDQPRILQTHWATITSQQVKILGETVVIFYSIGGYLHLVASYDGGRTFPVQRKFVDYVIGSIPDLIVREYNGELYFTWRVIIANNGTELLFARSLNDITGFTAPVLLTDQHDPLRVDSYDLAVIDEDNIFIAWQDDCLPSVSFCEWDATNLLRLSTKTGVVTVVSYEELAGAGTERVNLFSLNESLYVSYIDTVYSGSDNTANKEQLRIFDFDNDRKEIHTEAYQSPWVYGQLNPNFPMYLNNDTVFFSWSERNGPITRDFYYRTYSSGDEGFSKKRLLFTDDRDGLVNMITSFTSNGKTKIGWIEGKETAEKDIGWFKLHVHDVIKGTRLEYDLDILGTSDAFDPVSTYKPAFSFYGENEIILSWMVRDNTGKDEWYSDPNNEGSYVGNTLYSSVGQFVRPCTP